MHVFISSNTDRDIRMHMYSMHFFGFEHTPRTHTFIHFVLLFPQSTLRSRWRPPPLPLAMSERCVIIWFKNFTLYLAHRNQVSDLEITRLICEINRMQSVEKRVDFVLTRKKRKKKKRGISISDLKASVSRSAKFFYCFFLFSLPSFYNLIVLSCVFISCIWFCKQTLFFLSPNADIALHSFSTSSLLLSLPIKVFSCILQYLLACLHTRTHTHTHTHTTHSLHTQAKRSDWRSERDAQNVERLKQAREKNGQQLEQTVRECREALAAFESELKGSVAASSSSPSTTTSTQDAPATAAVTAEQAPEGSTTATATADGSSSSSSSPPPATATDTADAAKVEQAAP